MNKDLVDVKLSLDDNATNTASDVQKEFLEEEIKEIIPKIKKGVINISGVYVFENDENYEVKVYITNGLERPVKFEKVPLYMINSNGDKLAYQEFDLSHMEEIPPYSARPCKLEFRKENLFVDAISSEDWQIVFGGQNPEAVQYVDVELESIPEEMSLKEINTFNEFLKGLPGIERGQVSISVFTMTQYKNNNILMTLVIRNTTQDAIEIKTLPISVYTKDDKKVLSGVFEINDFKVNSCKARILSLVFPSEIVLDEDFDLSSCKINFSRQ